LPIDPDNRVRFEPMGLERVRIALVRGFDIPRGPMREDALDWVKEQEERRERGQRIVLVAAIAAASLVGGFGPSHKPTLATNDPLPKGHAQRSWDDA
jgi:hypothetical protein